MRKTLARDWAGKAAGRALRLGLGLLAGLALLTTTVASGTLPAATFSTAVNYGVGANPHGVAAGVFSKSGHMDLAVANQGGTVTVLLGDGRGGFAPAPGSPLSVAPASGPIAIAVGHFTGTLNLDIVTANQSGSVTVFPGNGDGTFKAAITSPTGSILPNALAVGDVNGDGKLDLAVTDQSSASVGILLGNGDGTFLAPTTLALDSFPSAVVLADLRNSGKPDLAVATGIGFVGHVDIFLNDGHGAFAPASPATVAVGPAPLALAAGNFNGRMDLLVANSNNTVSVLLGDGLGGFATAPSPVGVGSMPSAIAVGDFNGDGKLDFVTANNGDNTVSVVLGNGDGTFQPNNPATLAADLGPIALAVGDFNGDGELDLAVANQSSNDVSIFLNTTVVAPPLPALTSLALNPSSVTGGSPSAGTVTLSAAAPSGGAVVSLSSGDPSVASVPVSVTVLAAATSATFSVSTNPVSTSTSVTISGSYNGSTQGASLAVTPPTLTSVALSPSSVTGGSSSIGTVTLSALAPSGGAVVSLSSSNTGVASVPATVTVPGGSSSESFSVSTNPVSTSTSVSISGSYSGSTQAASLTVTPPALTSLGLSPSSLTGGSSSTGMVTLGGPAPSGGAVVSLSSSNPSVASVPASVTVAAGMISASFMVKTTAVSTSTSVTISGSYSGSTQAASLTVAAPPPTPNKPPTASISPDPPITCAGPNGAMVTLTGSGSDPDGDTLSFTWLDEHMNVVGNTAIVTVLVPPGTHTFTLQVSDGHGNVTSASTQVTVVPDTAPPSLSISLSPNVLWPPNNKLWPIKATWSVSDNCDPHPSIGLVRIWSNDPDDDKFDIKILNAHSFLLRARKADKGRDRIYTVTYQAADAAGNTTPPINATVVVPHSMGHQNPDIKHWRHLSRRED